MFKIEIDNELHLELIHPSHAKDIFDLVERNRELYADFHGKVIMHRAIKK